MASRSARASWRYLLVPYLLLAAVKLALAWPLDCPLKGDELAYLGNARYLATGGGLVDPTGRSPYKVGYSLLLVPAFLLTDDPVAGFKAAQVLNAFLLSLVYPAAFLLAGRLRPDLRLSERMLVASCLSLYPAALLYATTAMSANVFLPAYFLYLLAGLEALARGRWWSWALFGAAAAYLYAVHERAIGMLLVTLAAALVSLLSRRRRRLEALAAVAALAAALALLRLVEIPGSRHRTGATALRVVQQALSDPEALLVTAAGQLWYLGLATFGALFLGIGYLALRRGEAGTGFAVPRLFWPLVWGSAASVFAISVLFMSRRPEAAFTHWIYGRYNEGVLLPVLLLAILALKDPDPPLRRRTFVYSCLGTLATIAALSMVLRQAWSPAMGPPFSFSASSIPILLKPFGWTIPRAAAASLLGGLLVAALFARRWRWGVAGLSLLFALSTAVSYAETWIERYRVTDGQRELARLVERIDPERRVILHDRMKQPFRFHYYNLSYFLPDYEFRRLGQPTLGTADLALSDRLRFGRIYPKARLAGLENFARATSDDVLGLWVFPGPLQERLAGRGWLLPEGFPSRLDEDVLRSRLRMLGRLATGRWPAGGERTLRLEVEHRGTAPWPHRGGLGTGEDSVRLTAAWLPAAGGDGKAAARQWADLPRMLYPGESVPVELELRAAAAGDPLPPGAYRIVVAIAQERQGEPGSTAAETFTLTVEVGE